MCGISGIVDFYHKQEITEDKIGTMNKILRHRGPDDKGIFLNEERTVGLGHTRLSIVDLSPAGHQPMSNEDGSVWIVFNGEIYNHLSLREDLEKKGYRYHSRTDTETIIHLYEEKGEKCLDDLRGMFAFALWDVKKKKLFFARDRIGIKPFYYHLKGEAFYFASEIKAILTNEEIHRGVNTQALADYLTFMCVPAPQTMFQDIYKLPAGYCGTFSEKDGLKIYQYWDLQIKQDDSKTEQEWIERVRLNLRGAIQSHMVCDVPFGAFLSGGIDSSLITVLMQEMRGQPVDTFTIGFKREAGFDESGYARKIRDLYHTKYHEIFIDEDDLMRFLEKMAYHQDEPIADWVCFPLYYVAKLIRDSGVIVAQVGEGSDELFSGYPWFLHYLRLGKWQRAANMVPSVLRKLAFGAVSYTPYLRQPFLREIVRRISAGEFVFWGGANVYGEEEKGKLLKYKFEHPYRVIDGFLKKLAEHSPKADFLQKMIYIEFKQRLPELLLMRVDKMTMATSIESRVPFLDHVVVEEMMKIPSGLKKKNNEPKYILKKASEGIIPNDIIYRKKQGFGAPISQWLRSSDIYKVCRDLVMGSDMRSLGLFNHEYIEKMFEDHRAGKQDYGVKLWLLTNFALWYRAFLSEEKLET